MERNIFGGLLGAHQNQQAYQRQIANGYPGGLGQQVGNYTLGSGTATNITYAPEIQAYVVTPAKKPAPKTGEYRRIVREGEVRYSDDSLQWLDERVNEMCVVL